MVAQVLESAAGEMLSAAGKNHCQGGREGGRERELDIKQPGYTAWASVELIMYELRLILQQKREPIIIFLKGLIVRLVNIDLNLICGILYDVITLTDAPIIFQ